MIRSQNHEHYSNLRGFRRLLLCGVVCLAACKSLKFAISDLEQTGDIRAALALCYRAQKDQSAAGGGNTRNCDTLQAEVILFQRFETCSAALPTEARHCLCKVYRICDKAAIEN